MPPSPLWFRRRHIATAASVTRQSIWHLSFVRRRPVSQRCYHIRQPMLQWSKVPVTASQTHSNLHALSITTVCEFLLFTSRLNTILHYVRLQKWRAQNSVASTNANNSTWTVHSTAYLSQSQIVEKCPMFVYLFTVGCTNYGESQYRLRQATVEKGCGR